MSPPFGTPLGDGAPIDDLPRGPPLEWFPGKPRDGIDPLQLAIENLRKHARAAMIIEFTTIPLYLYAVWSIKPDNGGPGTKARYSILGIVQQEMLHLALVGNIARALDYEFKIYNDAAMAVFDGSCQMLYDKVQLNLEPAKKHLLGTFVKIEAPYTPPAKDAVPVLPWIRVGPPINDFKAANFGIESIAPQEQLGIKNEHIAKNYHSIGEFYDEFRKGLKEVGEKHPGFLKHNKDMQFTGDDFYSDQMVVVQDLDTALEAMDTIVDQGEGSVGVEDSHYRVFLELYRNRDMWECWPVEKNPCTNNYLKEDHQGKKKMFLYYLNRAFSACYCYLLRVIDDIWYDRAVARNKVVRHKLVRCMHPLMMDILTPLAEVIVQQEFGNGTAGPCFEMYCDERGRRYTRNTLRARISLELESALKTPESKDGGFKARLEAILFTVEHSLPWIEIGNNF